jgi:DNA-binding NarL/FixJ family response regulator
MSILNSSVLVIDHSSAVNRILSQYLRRVGFTEILTCETADSGIKTFQDLVDSGKKSLIFLGYHFPDSIASEIVPKLFEIAPDVKIIIESSLKEDDQKIVDLFSEGVFHYLPKPIRFDDLARIIDTIEKEIEEFSTIDERLVLGLLKTLKKISIVRLAEYCNCQTDVLYSFLQKLSKKSIVQEITKRKEIGCKECNSVNIHQIFCCVRCNSENFRKSTLIEHFSCGNVSPQYDYDGDTCSKCHKQIKILGVDYRTLQNFNICNDCKEVFPTPNQKFVCNNCHSTFSFIEINWITSRTYSIIHDPTISGLDSSDKMIKNQLDTRLV